MTAIRFLSVCSGIEAASVAWEPLGWTPVAFAEIDPFPSAVLAYRFPHVPNLGDFTRITAADVGAIDLLVGGTPCQPFSVAGLRGGLADDRGNLALEFLRLADRTRPRWLVWENVPGVLSTNGGRDFGAILGGMVELGYGFAYRVLDAQHFGVPQRRRRVFVVGYLGDWRPAAAVLFERHCLQGHSPPRREKRKGIAHDVAPCLGTSGRGFSRVGETRGQDPVIVASTGDISHCLNAGGMGRIDYETETLIAHSLRADGFDASEDGTGRGTPIIPIAIAFHARQDPDSGSVTHPLDTDGHSIAVAFSSKDHGADAGELAPTLRAMGHNTSHANAGGQLAVAAPGMRVRRLTPRECERLQGFPDDWTLVPYRGKPASDGPRYKALGNSMAVPVMRWIGERIAAVERMARHVSEAAE